MNRQTVNLSAYPDLVVTYLGMRVNMVKTYLSFVLAVVSISGITAGGRPEVGIRDLQLLMGRQWTGSLTYLDYSAKKKGLHRLEP
jgi:hypothetical protein